MNALWKSNLSLVLSLVTLGFSDVASSSSAAQAAEVVRTRWAVLIGVDDYIEINDLKYCSADQVALRDQLIGSGFPPDQVFLLHTGAKAPKYLPFKRNIEKQLTLILGMVEENDVVVVAFSGHGVHFGTSSYLCPMDADLDDQKSLLSLKSVYGTLKTCSASMKILLVDACRNDPRLDGQRKLPQGNRELPERNREFSRSPELQRPPEGIVLLNSCAPGEISREEDQFGHGVFMYYLLKGLKGEADSNKNGSVSLGELSGFARRNTAIFVARQFNDSQRPFLKAEGDIRTLEFAISRNPRIAFTNSVGMKLVKIPAGKFIMGSGHSAVETRKSFDIREPDFVPEWDRPFREEHPQHNVSISRSFYFGSTEVTQGHWTSIMQTRPWRNRDRARESSHNAASYITWEDATEFCRRLSAKDGRTYRLPTEAEWEYACRAGTTTMYSFGDDASQLNRHAWYHDNAVDFGEQYAHGVGMKPPNAWGLYDMHGNVSEWCADWFGQKFYDGSQRENPRGPSSGTQRVVRGGAWFSTPQFCRSAARSAWDPTDPSYGRGFRVACELE